MRLVTVVYLSRSGISRSFADSHFGLVSVLAVVFRLRSVAFTSDRMVTRCVVLVVCSHPRQRISLQNRHSMTGCRRLLLCVSQRHKVQRK